MSRAKKGLSYVLGDANAKENHILPINAMQFSRCRGQLFTAGRDGVVKVWSASRQASPSTDAYESAVDLQDIDDQQDVAETILKLETSLSSSPLSYHAQSPNPDAAVGIIKSYDVHFDWINDLKLVNKDQHIVSASADLSMKLMDLDGDEHTVHKFENLHTDYIKKISSIPSSNSLVSGGLDGLVITWDMATLRPTSSFTNSSTGLNLPNSIYALSNDNGNLISTGGPNNTINVYDNRMPSMDSSNLIRKLVGHQDNVRCLLMNSQYILSGSSDSTIKLWDMRNFNVYKNFDVHDDAIWSLSTACSSDPGFRSTSLEDFKEIYSGDKAGNIIKTDLNYISSYSISDEYDNLFSSTFTSSDQEFVAEKLGLCTLVAKATSPIVSLCVEGDESIFASTYFDLERFYIPETKNLARYQYLRTSLDHLDNLGRKYDDDLGTGLESSADPSDLNSDFYDIVSHLSMDTSNRDGQVPISDKGQSPSTSHQNEDLTEQQEVQYTSMFLNINGGPSLEFVNAYKDEQKDFNSILSENKFVDETPVELLLNPIPPEQLLTIPFNKSAFQQFNISPKSIVLKRMFNNKRRLIALYMNGDIKIWDVLVCKVVKLFPCEDGGHRLSEDELKERTKIFEELYQKYETVETLNHWCEIDMRSGKLLVTLSETYFNNVEIYYDELISDYPFLKADHTVVTGPTRNPVVTADTRFFLARIFLNSLFQSYTRFEWEVDEKLREAIRTQKIKPRIAPPNGESSHLEQEDAPRKKKLFSRMSSKSSIPRVKTSISPSGSVSSGLSEAIADISLLDDNSVEVPDDSISKMLKFNLQYYKDKINSLGQKKPLKSLFKLYIDETTLPEDGDLEHKPVIPVSEFPPDLLVIIFEKSPDLGNYRDLCSFHLEDIEKLASNLPVKDHQLVNSLRMNLPKWIGAPILYNRFPMKESPKISFQLFEIDYELLPPDKKIGGKSQKKIKRLPDIENSIKLTSHCMLRVSKILQYLTEKFESRTSEMKAKKPPTEWLTLECKGRELNNKMTLQTIKTTIWKSGSDIELYFHRKFD